MKGFLPYLEVKAADGSTRKIFLRSTVINIGRFPENEVELEDFREVPYISRRHCVLTQELGEWWLTSLGRNGTELVREGQVVPVESSPEAKMRIGSGDVIRIHGYELTFTDPNETAPLKRKVSQLRKTNDFKEMGDSELFVFRVSQGQEAQGGLYCRGQERWEEISLRFQVMKMLCYMARKNLNAPEEPQFCSREELEAYFAPDDYPDIATLVKEVRRKLNEMNGDGKQLLETRIKRGYRLMIRCEYLP